LLRPILTYGSEAWKNNHVREECARNILTKMVKKIYGQVDEGEHWKKKKCVCLYACVCVQHFVI